MDYYHSSYRVATGFQEVHGQYKLSSFLSPSLHFQLPVGKNYSWLMTFLKILDKSIPVNMVKYLVEEPEVKGLEKRGEDL